MIDIKNWKHKTLIEMDCEIISCPIKQLIDCMPDEKDRTEEEKELYNALVIVHKYI